MYGIFVYNIYIYYIFNFIVDGLILVCACCGVRDITTKMVVVPVLDPSEVVYKYLRLDSEECKRSYEALHPYECIASVYVIVIQSVTLA